MNDDDEAAAVVVVNIIDYCLMCLILSLRLYTLHKVSDQCFFNRFADYKLFDDFQTFC